jgi:hypothetical protein
MVGVRSRESADAVEVKIKGFYGLCADKFFFIDKGRRDSRDYAGSAVGFVEDFGGGGESEKGSIASVDEGITQGAGKGCY